MTAPPRAATLQGGANEADEPLVQFARRQRPQRRWWWGVRVLRAVETNIYDLPSGYITGLPHVTGRRTGAWCYLCERSIATWSGRWPVTASAQQAIAAHRTDHIQGRLDTPPTGESDR